MAAAGAVDVVILDLGLPDVAGETVAAEMRRSSATPILMLVKDLRGELEPDPQPSHRRERPGCRVPARTQP